MKNLLKSVTNYSRVPIDRRSEIKISETKLICGIRTQKKIAQGFDEQKTRIEMNETVIS